MSFNPFAEPADDEGEDFQFKFVKGHAKIELSDEEDAVASPPPPKPPAQFAVTPLKPPTVTAKNNKVLKSALKKNVTFASPNSLCQFIPGETLVEVDNSYVLYQALFDYNSADPDDLKFLQNDIIRVTDEGDGPSSWFYGSNQNGEEGHFPGTYVRKIRMAASKISVDVESGTVVKQPTTGVAPPVTAPVVTVAAPAVKEEKKYILYQALYKYKSDDPDDLQFEQNDILRVTDEGDGPTSWFYGEDQQGKEGNFPGTFVRKIRMPSGGAVKTVGGLEHIN